MPAKRGYSAGGGRMMKPNKGTSQVKRKPGGKKKGSKPKAVKPNAY